MRYRKPLLGCLLLFFSNTSFSQAKQYLYYFDKDLNTTVKGKAVYYGIGENDQGLIKLTLYNSAHKNLVLIEHFTDSSLQIIDGLFQSYYENKILESEGNYIKGKVDGLWRRWDNKGRITDSSFYHNGEEMMAAAFGYHKNSALDSFVIKNNLTGQLQKTFYDNKGRLLSEVSYIGEKGLKKIYKNGALLRADSFFRR